MNPQDVMDLVDKIGQRALELRPALGLRKAPEFIAGTALYSELTSRGFIHESTFLASGSSSPDITIACYKHRYWAHRDSDIGSEFGLGDWDYKIGDDEVVRAEDS